MKGVTKAVHDALDLASPTVEHETIQEINEALLLGSLRQHALVEAAETANVQLREEIDEHKLTETALQGRFRLTLRKDLRLDYPRAETATHYMTMAMDPDLDQCVVRALRDMIVLLGEKRNLSREDAYTLCSLAADLRVTQTVNGSKGIHCMIAKTVVHG